MRTEIARPSKKMTRTTKGMLREDKSGKLNFLDYEDLGALIRYARHMKRRELKHGRGAWKTAAYAAHYSLADHLQSIKRHLTALEFIASDLPVPHELQDYPGEDHAAAIRFNVTAFMAIQERHSKLP
jgi:hypothetical protein